MFQTFWSSKGGSGVTVTACAAALELRRRGRPVLVVDLAGDVPAALGSAEPSGPGLADWAAMDRPRADALARLVHEVDHGLSVLVAGDAALSVDVDAELLVAALAPLADHVVVDAGVRTSDLAHERWCSVLGGAGRSVMVTRACYLSLRRAVRARPDADGVVVLAEPGRALGSRDVADIVDLPLVATLEWDPAVARSVDSGLLVRRPPKGLLRAVGALG